MKQLSDQMDIISLYVISMFNNTRRSFNLIAREAIITNRIRRRALAL